MATARSKAGLWYDRIPPRCVLEPAAMAERNHAILAALASGLTNRAAGRQFGLSPERVRQIRLVETNRGRGSHLDRQIATPYADLSEQEKQSDREQVMRYWTLIVAFVGEWLTSQGARISDHNPEALDTADWLLGCWREDMEPKP